MSSTHAASPSLEPPVLYQGDCDGVEVVDVVVVVGVLVVPVAAVAAAAAVGGYGHTGCGTGTLRSSPQSHCLVVASANVTVSEQDGCVKASFAYQPHWLRH